MTIGVTDGEETLAAIDNLAAQGPKGFVICTPDTRLGPTIVGKAKVANLELLAVDEQFLGADGQPMKNVHYLGISAGRIGEEVGRTLVAEMKRCGWAPDETTVCAMIFKEVATIKERTDGAIAALTAAGFPADRLYKTAQRTNDIPGSFDAVDVLLTQRPGIKHWLVCGGNDTAVRGPVRALEGRGYPSAQDALLPGARHLPPYFLRTNLPRRMSACCARG